MEHNTDLHAELTRQETLILGHAPIDTLQVGAAFQTLQSWTLPDNTPTSPDVDLSVRLRGELADGDPETETTLEMRGRFESKSESDTRSEVTQIDIGPGLGAFDLAVSIPTDSVSYPIGIALDVRATDEFVVEQCAAILAFDNLPSVG